MHSKYISINYGFETFDVFEPVLMGNECLPPCVSVDMLRGILFLFLETVLLPNEISSTQVNVGRLTEKRAVYQASLIVWFRHILDLCVVVRM